MHSSSTGRTGRFGRKGISINFVHDKRTWTQMEQIEQATGRQIVRIETSDLDEMESVRGLLLSMTPWALIPGGLPQQMKKALK